RTRTRSDAGKTLISERKVEPEEDPVAPGAERMRSPGGQVDAVAERQREQRGNGHPRQVVALEEVPAHLEVEDLGLARPRLEDDVALEATGLHPVVADRGQEAVREAVVELRRQTLRVPLETAREPVGHVEYLVVRVGAVEVPRPAPQVCANPLAPHVEPPLCRARAP